MTSRLDEIVSATPATRNRWVDFLRAASIVAVVFGHWMIGIIAWDGGIIRTTSAIGVTPLLWLATWFLQVMPIFFFVGGFSNLVTSTRRGDAAHRRGRSSTGRIDRLLRPSLVFLGVWAVVMVILHLSDIGAQAGPAALGRTRGCSAACCRRGRPCRSGRCGSSPSTSWSCAIARGPSGCTVGSGWWVPAVMALGACVVDVIGVRVRPSRPPLGERGVRPAVPAPAGALLRRRDVRAMAAPRSSGRWWSVGLGGLVRADEPRRVRGSFGDARFDWFPGIGALPEEPARHRRRARLERLPADRAASCSGGSGRSAR